MSPANQRHSPTSEEPSVAKRTRIDQGTVLRMQAGCSRACGETAQMQKRRTGRPRDQVMPLRRVLLCAVGTCVVLAVVLFTRQLAETTTTSDNMSFVAPTFTSGWFAQPEPEPPEPALELGTPSELDVFKYSPMQMTIDKIAGRIPAVPPKPKTSVQQEDAQLGLEAEAPVKEQAVVQDPLQNPAEVPAKNPQQLEEELPVLQDQPDDDLAVQQPDGDATEVESDQGAVVPHWYTLQGEKNLLSNPAQMYSHDFVQEVKQCVMTNSASSCSEPYTQLTFNDGKVYLATALKDGDPSPSPLYEQLAHGLVHHPMVNLTENIFEADLIVVVTTSHVVDTWGEYEPAKLIVVDDTRTPHLSVPRERAATMFNDSWYLAYFKHEYTHKSEGSFQCYPFVDSNSSSIFPIVPALPLSDSHPSKAIPPLASRKIDILFAHTEDRSKSDQSIRNVRQWVESYASANAALTTVLAVPSDRSVVELMCDSKVVVLTHPSDSESFAQLLQALACGALVFVDWTHTPHPYPFSHMQHLVFYSTSDEQQFKTTLDNMLAGLDRAQKIADQGFMHVLSKHSTVSLADYVLRTAITARNDTPSRRVEYEWTGQTLIEGLREKQCSDALVNTLRKARRSTTAVSVQK